MAKTDCIDISYANTGLDYAKLKANGIKAAIIRVGQRNFKDNMFETHYSGAKNAGMKIGAYWFTEAHNTSEAKTEAKRCVSYLAGRKLDFPVYMDIEDYSGNSWYPSRMGRSTLTEIAMTFCATVQSSGYRAGVYANPSFFGSVLDHGKISKSYSIWCAHWNVSSPSYSCDIWQNGVGSLPGSNGAIDKDTILNDKFASGTNALEAFLKIAKEHAIDRSEAYEDWTRGVLGQSGYSDWCAWFICACAKKVGALDKIIPFVGWVDGMMNGVKNLGGTLHSANSYTPKPGDLFSLHYSGQNSGYHIGIVYSVSGNSFTSCEGNHVPTSRSDTGGYLSGSSTYSLPNSKLYQFATPDWGSIGGFYDGGSSGGGRLYSTEYTRADAIIREVGFLDKDYNHTLVPSKMRLCVMNYTPLLADLWERYGYGGTSGGGVYGTPNSRGWVWPTPGYGKGYITSWYAESRSYETHNAIDIGAPMGSKVLAGKAGKVISCYGGCTHNYGKSSYMWDTCGGGFGNNVWIDHGGGYVTIYGHLQRTMVTEGASVSTGQQIGEVGSTGWSTGAHLHYELRINGRKSNPLDLYSDGDIR